MAGPLARLTLDVSPLRHGQYRLLFGAQLVSAFGSMLSSVALPYQTYVITHSSLAVGLLGLAEFPLLLTLAFLGGVFADTHDRRRIVQAGDLAFAAATLGLVINAATPAPRLWPLYVVAALTAGLDALQRPALDALVPRLVPRDELPAAAALSSLRYTVFGVVGPAVAGVTIAWFGFSVAYAIDVATFVTSFALLCGLRAVEPTGAQPASVSRALQGFRYAMGRRDLLGTYLVDFIAMFFGMPNALFPALASQYGGAAVVGAFYAAPALGAMLAAVASGWTARVRRHGRAIVIAALVWGVAIASLGAIHGFVPALAALAVAGAADAISGLFRQTIWNQTIPDALRGRLAGIEFISYASGPTLGDVEAGAVAAVFGTRVSVLSGGVLCVVGVAVAALALPELWRYDSAAVPTHAESAELLR
ncbi:MAG: MFS transporter [Candidatus Eremiobacteraeota bacterium]|nr:MFS transporter [Candidatus Eremiobacteraeota bacterium]